MVVRVEAKKTIEDDGRIFTVEELQALLPGWKDGWFRGVWRVEAQSGADRGISMRDGLCERRNALRGTWKVYMYIGSEFGACCYSGSQACSGWIG